jgi:hypothetical protein
MRNTTAVTKSAIAHQRNTAAYPLEPFLRMSTGTRAGTRVCQRVRQGPYHPLPHMRSNRYAGSIACRSALTCPCASHTNHVPLEALRLCCTRRLSCALRMCWAVLCVGCVLQLGGGLTTPRAGAGTCGCCCLCLGLGRSADCRAAAAPGSVLVAALCFESVVAGALMGGATRRLLLLVLAAVLVSSVGGVVEKGTRTAMPCEPALRTAGDWVSHNWWPTPYPKPTAAAHTDTSRVWHLQCLCKHSPAAWRWLADRLARATDPFAAPRASCCGLGCSDHRWHYCSLPFAFATMHSKAHSAACCCRTG